MGSVELVPDRLAYGLDALRYFNAFDALVDFHFAETASGSVLSHRLTKEL